MDVVPQQQDKQHTISINDATIRPLFDHHLKLTQDIFFSVFVLFDICILC